MKSRFRPMSDSVNPPASAKIQRRALHGMRRAFLAAAALLATMGGVLGLTPDSQARVNPLVVIERQLHKANMLIVLDTSGSMTGVPGGQFANSTEVGVDCDNGSNCRNGGVLGVCAKWGRT